jgi:hypothetical protein
MTLDLGSTQHIVQPNTPTEAAAQMTKPVSSAQVVLSDLADTGTTQVDGSIGRTPSGEIFLHHSGSKNFSISNTPDGHHDLPYNIDIHLISELS